MAVIARSFPNYVLKSNHVAFLFILNSKFYSHIEERVLIIFSKLSIEMLIALSMSTSGAFSAGTPVPCKRRKAT